MTVWDQPRNENDLVCIQPEGGEVYYSQSNLVLGLSRPKEKKEEEVVDNERVVLKSDPPRLDRLTERAMRRAYLFKH